MQKIYLLAFILVNSLMTAISQESYIPFEVNINHPPLSLSQDQLFAANNLTDLNRLYKDEWVREYLSVEFSSMQKGQVIKVDGENFLIGPKEKRFLKNIQFPATITVTINYIPENNLKHNPPKEESFTFSVHPNKSASFVGGHEKLEMYLQEKVISKIGSDILTGYDLAVVKFIINEQGQVVDTSIFQSTKDDDTDALLYEVICDMPNWIPAEHTNRTKVRQEFVFTIGNHENCIINMFNTNNNMY